MSEIGKVSHFYDRLSVAIIKLSGPLKVGDGIEIKGATTGLKQKVESMQFDHQDITEGAAGQEVGIKVGNKVRPGDAVFAASQN